MKRRNFIILSISSILGIIIGGEAMANTEVIELLTLSDEEWKARLSKDQYRILRKEETESPFSSKINHEKREGVFACVACDLEIFESKMKFDSGTGWPSFFDVIKGHVERKRDFKMFLPRTEYHCIRCGGHHGHIFKDGPEPTGLRYCNNGLALKFIPKA